MKIKQIFTKDNNSKGNDNNMKLINPSVGAPLTQTHIQTTGKQNKKKNPSFRIYFYLAWPRAGPCGTGIKVLLSCSHM